MKDARLRAAAATNRRRKPREPVHAPRTRRRTQRATGTAHGGPHARRATGALSEERPTTKTTARHASGTMTRRSMSARARSSPMRGPGLAQLSRRRTPRTQEESLGGSIAYVATRRPGATRYGDHTGLFCVFESTHGAYVHMAEDSNRTAYDAVCRGRDAVPCVHPHARRATGATGALSEERSTAKTTVCRASGTTTRRVTHERARSSPMRGPGLAQLSRRRTPRIQEESLGDSNRTSRLAVPERRVMATTRASSVCTSVHMVRMYTWPRTATERRTTPSAADATPYPACQGYSARPSSRAARYRRYRRAD